MNLTSVVSAFLIFSESESSESKRLFLSAFILVSVCLSLHALTEKLLTRNRHYIGVMVPLHSCDI